MLQNSDLIGIQNPNFYTNTKNDLAKMEGLNLNLYGNISWIGACIIWGAETLSQKYKRSVISWYQIIYFMFGMYLFFLGYSSGLNIRFLS
jgi:hypothetical protein